MSEKETASKTDLTSTDGQFSVCLFGAYLDTENMGCSALTVSLIKLIVECRPNARIYQLARRRRKETQEVQISEKQVRVYLINCRFYPRGALKDNLLWIYFLLLIYRIIPVSLLRACICRSTPWIKVLVEANMVGDIRAGDSFSDIYGLRRFIRDSLLCCTVIVLGKKLLLLPQTYGPYKSRIARFIARFFMLHSHRILARDKESMEVVRNLLGKKAKGDVVQFCPDVAFALDAALPEAVNISPALNTGPDSPVIGLNVSGLLYRGGYTQDNMFGLKCNYNEAVQGLVTMFLENPTVHVLLVPHVFAEGIENDSDACREVLDSVPDSLRDRVHIIMQEYNQSEIKGIIGLCDFFIGSRLHSCIASISQGIPTVGIAYSKKFRGIFESVGMADMVIDARKATSDDVLSKCMDHFNNRGRISADLARKIPMIPVKILACFKNLKCM